MESGRGDGDTTDALNPYTTEINEYTSAISVEDVSTEPTTLYSDDYPDLLSMSYVELLHVDVSKLRMVNMPDKIPPEERLNATQPATTDVIPNDQSTISQV